LIDRLIAAIVLLHDGLWLSSAVEVFRLSTQLLQLYISLNTLNHVAVGC